MMYICNKPVRHKLFLLFCFILSISISAFSQNYTEGFDVVVPPPAGWAVQNLSSPNGTISWFQGNNTVFPAQSGAANSYAGVNFNSTTGNNTISNWLFTPNRTYNNGDVFTFYTRASDQLLYPDRLEVRLSVSGASVNAGTTATSVGDFSTLLLSVNPTLTTTGYPTVWTQYTITISGLPLPLSGRIAFRYFVTNGGPSGANSDYIGIDNVNYTSGFSCTMTASASVISNINGAQISCFGAADGVMQVTPASGTPSYTYLWSNGATTATITDLSAGTYDVTVTDANSCTATSSAMISAPAAINPMTTVTNVSCNGGNNGEINLSVTGGIIAPYSYDWTNDGPDDPDNDSQDLTGLVAGIYTVTVTDVNGCTGSTSAMVTEPINSTFTFIGPGSDFNVPTNWQGGCIPPLNTPGTVITINSGQTLNLNGNLTADIINNGTLTGTVNLNGDITNNGNTSPGN